MRGSELGSGTLPQWREQGTLRVRRRGWPTPSPPALVSAARIRPQVVVAIAPVAAASAPHSPPPDPRSTCAQREAEQFSRDTHIGRARETAERTSKRQQQDGSDFACESSPCTHTTKRRAGARTHCLSFLRRAPSLLRTSCNPCQAASCCVWRLLQDTAVAAMHAEGM